MKGDIIKGSIAGSLVAFTIPLILSGLFQQIFNWVDAFIVGNIKGEAALAAIGAATPVYHLFVAVITGFTSGISVLTAQQYGMGEQNTIRQILSSFTIVLGGVFLLIAVLGSMMTGAILKVLETPPDIFITAKDYMQLLFFGIPFLAVYNMYAAVLRGLGDSKVSFWAVLTASFANAILDLILVFPLGAKGAAIATAATQGFMAVFVILYAVKKYPALRFRIKRSSVWRIMLLQGCKFGLPPAVQSATSSVGNLALQRFMNGFGEQTVAAITTAYRVDSVIILPMVNFGSGIATVAAQNIGAGNEIRAKQTLKIGAGMIALISLGLTGFVIWAGGPMIAIFGLQEESILIGRTFFRTIASCYIVFSLAMSVRGYLEGAGDLLFTGIVGILALGVRVAVSYMFAERFGNMVIGYAEAFSWTFMLIVYIFRFFARTRKSSRERDKV